MNTIKPSVLFICTGNYYRSRFAESIFNDLAKKMGKPQLAFSRGLEVLKTSNPGPISVYTRNRLQELSISLDEPIPYPIQLQLQDFERAEVTVLLDEEEHRPMMRKYFPTWEEQVEYWKVHDIDKTSPKEALPVIEKLTRTFFEEWAERQ